MVVPRSVAFVLTLALLCGCGGKLARAEKALDAFARGDAQALDVAVAYADAAVEKDPADAEAQAVRGRAYLAASVTDPGPDRLAVAVDAFERALGTAPSASLPPALHGTLSASAPVLEEQLLQRLVNEVEARNWGPADVVLALTIRARRFATALLGADGDREAKVDRIAAVVATERGRPMEAREAYLRFAKGSGRDDRPLACLVARGLAAAGHVEEAVAFVGPLSSRYPNDETLLRTEVDILMDAGRTAEAVARINQALPMLEQSVSGAFLAAALFDAAEEDARARMAWERVLALDPRHVDARIALGQSLMARARALGTEVHARSDELDQRRPPRDLLDLVAAVSEAWRGAEEVLVAAVAVDPNARPAAAALVGFYQTRVGEYDAESEDAAQQARLAAEQQKLDAALAVLAALERK